MILPPKEFWDVFKKTPGALSCTEALAIMNIAAEAPEGDYLELGTYRGKSAYAASRTLKEGSFYLVEPEFNKSIDPDEVERIVWRKGVNVDNSLTPFMVSDYSLNIIPDFNELSYVLIDSGSHQDGLPMQEVKLLEDRVIPGGIVAFHDFKNQFREPAEAAEYLVSTGKYEWIDIVWQTITDYVRENNLEEGNDSWHIYEDRPFPNFVGAVKRK